VLFGVKFNFCSNSKHFDYKKYRGKNEKINDLALYRSKRVWNISRK